VILEIRETARLWESERCPKEGGLVFCYDRCRWQKRYRIRPSRGGGSSERELSGPVTGDPLAREPNGSSPAAASQRALHRRSSPRYSIREYEESRLQAARRS